MKKHIESYLAGVNEGSRKSITDRLVLFVKYLGKNDLDAITTEDMDRWVRHVQTASTKPATKYAYLSTVRHFLSVLSEQGRLDRNPWPAHIRMCRPESSPRYVPERKKAKELLEKSAQLGKNPVRTRAILELCYGSGLRRRELHNLNLSDLVGDTVRIRGKGGKERVVPVGKKAAYWMEKYVRTERLKIVERNNPLEEAFFLSFRGTRLGINSYALLVRTLLPGKGRNGLSLHSLRHACATHMLENGASIGVLQKLLGHENLSTTQVYTRVETKTLKKMMAKYHPRR